METPVVDLAVVEQPKGTVGVTRKINLGNYEHEEISVFVQYPITFGNEAATVQAANDAAFQAKSVVYSQLGLEGELVNDILRVKAAFPGATVAESPLRTQDGQGGIAAGVPAEARAEGNAPVPSAGASTGSSQVGATASDPVCPECQGPLWDNRKKNAARKAEGKKALPEGRCKNYQDPPEGTGCTGIVWSWSKGV